MARDRTSRVENAAGLVLLALFVVAIAPAIARRMPKPAGAPQATERPRDGWLARRDLPSYVDGDPNGELVGVFSAESDHALHVVAFGGTSFEERWRAGPYGSVRSVDPVVLVVGERVVVSDGRSEVRVLDTQTGRELHAHTIPGATALCRSGTGVLVASAGSAEAAKRLNVVDGAVDDAPAGSACPAPVAGCRAGEETGCAGDLEIARVDDVAAPAVALRREFRHGGYAVAFGATIDSEGESAGMTIDSRREPYAVGGDRTQPNAWRMPIRHAADTARPRHVKGALVFDRFVSAYDVADDAPCRVVMRDASTGIERWHTELAGPDRGAPLAFDLRGDWALVVVGRSLYVLDARDGKLARRIGPR